MKFDAYKNRVWIAIISGLLCFTVFAFSSYRTYSYEIANKKLDVSLKIEMVAKAMENALNLQIYKSKGILSFYAIHPNISYDEFKVYSDLLYEDTQNNLRSITLMRDTTVFFVTPLKGNETVMGKDLSKISAQRMDILKVKQTNEMIISPPAKLLQGGTGIIIRIPVISAEETKRYLGQMSVVIDSDKFQNETGLTKLFETYDVVVTQKNTDNTYQTIYTNVDGPKPHFENYRMQVGSRDWQFSYAPKVGWTPADHQHLYILLIGLLTSMVAGTLVGRLLGEAGRLNALVNERTSDLIRTNEYLEQTLGEVEEKQAELFLLNDQLEQSLDHLKETQEQLIQSEKFAALGELVAGVAHEINTPLGIGITLATFIQDKHNHLIKDFEASTLSKNELREYNEALSEAIEVMVNSLNRSAEIISSFKNVAGEQSVLELRTFNVKKYFDDVLQNLKPRLKKTNHCIELICDPELEIYHYPGVFSHILTNFIVNSLTHGFEEGIIGHIQITFEQKDETCTLIYTDDGVGISEDHLPHVFNPFYTTKKGQGSTGLGLHIIYNIVTQNLGGQIQLKTEKNGGVEFKIHFPALHSENFITVD